MKKFLLLYILFNCCLQFQLIAQVSYFPPAAPQAWDTMSPATLNWCPDKIDSLYNFLDQKNSKAFIILKDGKIVLEKYFGTFTLDSLWYWASAGKTLTSFLTGIAQQEGLLNINDNVTSYLGSGWSSCSSVQEDSITIRHILTMSSGLDDYLPPCSNEDETPSCLAYLAPAGTRWAYHTGAYRKLQDILPIASSVNINTFTALRVKNKIAMDSGIWLQDVFYSKLRDAARFGLLCLNNGIWQNDTVLSDSAYFNTMINTSQNYNLSYGYLTWLNGKNSFMVPGLQNVFNGYIIPNAPADMYAALGKNDQKIYVVPSQNLVVVRLGEAAYSSSLAITIFDNELWQKINELNCLATTAKNFIPGKITINENPFRDYIHVSSKNRCTYDLSDITGKIIYTGNAITEQNFSWLLPGIYFLKAWDQTKYEYVKLIKQ